MEILEISGINCWRQWNLTKLVLNFSIFQTFSNLLSKSHFSNTNISFFVPPHLPQPITTLSFWEPWKCPIWIGLPFTVINDSLLFKPFQPSVAFCIETFIWFALQIMPGFYMECYTELKCVKREYSFPQILNLSLLKCF